MKIVGLYSVKFKRKFTIGSGTQYGYVGGSWKKCLYGRLKALATSFSSSNSDNVNLLFFTGTISGKRYTFLLPFRILYLVYVGLVCRVVA